MKNLLENGLRNSPFRKRFKWNSPTENCSEKWSTFSTHLVNEKTKRRCFVQHMSVNGILHKCGGNTTEKVFLTVGNQFCSLCFVFFRAASWITRLNNSLKLIRWLPTRRMNGAASLDRWNCSGWKLNTATNFCFCWQKKLVRERLNLQEELAVEAYPTFVAVERDRLTCMSLHFVNSCDRSTACVTKFSRIPASGKREMLVFRTKWLEIFLPQACRPAFLAAFGKNWPIWFLPSGDTLYQVDLLRQALWFMARKKGEVGVFASSGRWLSKILKYWTGHRSVPVANIFGLNCRSCEPSNPWRVLLPLSSPLCHKMFPFGGQPFSGMRKLFIFKDIEGKLKLFQVVLNSPQCFFENLKGRLVRTRHHFVYGLLWKMFQGACQEHQQVRFSHESFRWSAPYRNFQTFSIDNSSSSRCF